MLRVCTESIREAVKLRSVLIGNGTGYVVPQAAQRPPRAHPRERQHVLQQLPDVEHTET